MLDVPKALSFGLKVIILSVPVTADKISIETFSDSIKSLLLELTERIRLSSKSTSIGVILIEISEESSSTTWSDISLSSGASLTLVTIKLNKNGWESNSPSFAITLNSANPYWLSIEFIVKIFEFILVVINEVFEFKML